MTCFCSNIYSSKVYDHVFKIYSSFEDEYSRKLFFARLQSSLTGNYGYLYKVLLNTDCQYRSIDALSLFVPDNGGGGGGIVLYGNKDDKNILKTICTIADYLGMKFLCACIKGEKEVNDSGQTLLPLITEDKLFSEYFEFKILIYSDDGWTKKDYFDLINKGIKSDNISILCSLLNKQIQYFDTDIIIPHKNEVFVDGGVFDFWSSIEFAKWCNGEYDAIYAFELDTRCCENIKNVIQTNESIDKGKVHFFNAGLWSKSKSVSFSGKGIGNSKVIPWGKDMVKTVSLDKVLHGRRVTFIKLDVEGAELEALKGAKSTIQKWRPRLAISIYHKPEDIIDIPLYILSLVPDYKCYIRHYSNYIYETVLFCI
jgi:FkbM family methyltransferase